MFRQIVVALDGQEGGRDAIALAKRLLGAGGELVLAHVYAGDPHVYRSASAAYEAGECERSLQLLEDARREADVSANLRFVGAPSVGFGLHVIAEDVAADLLVVGSSRRTLLGRVLIADDTRAALNASPCAVAVAPAGYVNEPDVVREIGVGYDGSLESQHALEVARQLADELGARVSAFEAVAPPRYLFDRDFAGIGESVEDFVEEARHRVASLGDLEPHAAYGQAAEELALYSASLDLLVIGSRGYGPIGRLIHGSTSHELARRARCPLLVLPRAARTPAPHLGDRQGAQALIPSRR